MHTMKHNFAFLPYFSLLNHTKTRTLIFCLILMLKVLIRYLRFCFYFVFCFVFLHFYSWHIFYEKLCSITCFCHQVVSSSFFVATLLSPCFLTFSIVFPQTALFINVKKFFKIIFFLLDLCSYQYMILTKIFV